MNEARGLRLNKPNTEKTKQNCTVLLVCGTSKEWLMEPGVEDWPPEVGVERC